MYLKITDNNIYFNNINHIHSSIKKIKSSSLTNQEHVENPNLLGGNFHTVTEQYQAKMESEY